MKRTVLLIVALTIAATACTAESREEWMEGPRPMCDTTSLGRLLLLAQSAPDATLIPCIGDLPPGWEYLRARTSASHGMLSFANHTFDLDADVVLSPSCDLSGARQADSPRPGTQLFVSGDGTTISFKFEGGCTQFDYETRQLAESDEGQGLIDGVPFMTRDTLRALSGMTL